MATMLTMAAQIEIYEQMCALSTRMVEAAKDNDWEALVALEGSVSSLRDTLLANEDSGSLSATERDQKAALIQRILEDDAEIRRHTEPWMEHLRQYLGSISMQQRVNDAYSGAANSFGGAPR